MSSNPIKGEIRIDIHTQKSMWRHRERAAIYKPRQETLPTPSSQTSSLQNCEKKNSIVSVTHSVVLCYSSPSKLIHYTEHWGSERPHSKYVAEWESESRSKHELPFPSWVLSLTQSRCWLLFDYIKWLWTDCRTLKHSQNTLYDRAIIPKFCVDKYYCISDSMDWS